jgi:hypothetical protein
MPVFATPRNGVTAKNIIVEPSTLISLGFEWPIEGDDNRNAAVAVSYRKKGDRTWKEALPLFRLQSEKIDAAGLQYVAPNMFAGSIFDLEPDTEYEVRLVLSDPDGVSGRKEEILTARTRREPVPATGGHVYHVYPPGFQGPMQQPAFIGLKKAYFVYDIGGDWYNAYPPRVQPGDIILVHAGLYKDDRIHYGHELNPKTPCCGTTWDGTYYLTASGTAEKPIVIKAAGDGEVIFDGDGNHNLFNLMAANYNYFEGITFRNTDVAMEAGLKDIAGSAGLTVKHCRFEQVGEGIHTDWSGSKNYYIADNVFIGKHDPHVLEPFMLWPQWRNIPGIPDPLTLSQLAVKVYGSGNVVAYNRVRNFHDGIDHATYGIPDGYPDFDRDRIPVSNDFYNNDISNMHDDCIEADGGAFNMRVFRNRCVNAAGSGISLQTIWGGPAYVIRNLCYHVPSRSVIKLSMNPAGGVFYHNTIIGPIRPDAGANMHFRNNLFLADDPHSPAFALNSFTSYSSSDYNGFAPGEEAPAAFIWRAPAQGADYTNKVESRSFKSLGEYSEATGQDKHSVLVNFQIFQNLQPADVNQPTHVYDPDSINFELKAGGLAIDAGVRLPNVNDGFLGAAPDLGALEFGAPLPHYGPRETDPSQAAAPGSGVK